MFQSAIFWNQKGPMLKPFRKSFFVGLDLTNYHIREEELVSFIRFVFASSNGPRQTLVFSSDRGLFPLVHEGDPTRHLLVNYAN